MSSTDSQSQQQPQRSKLQAVNYANILAYILNVTVTYAVGASGYFPTNGELSAKYQTLVTPAGYAFAIWGIIFLCQLIWAILQLLPAYRSNDVVIKGVGYWYVIVCVAQCAWSFLFANEWLEASLVAMISILVGLVVIVQQLASYKDEITTWKYWGLVFPFEIHCGWIWAASVVNANVVLVGRHASANFQVGSAWISLILLALVAAYYLLLLRSVYVVPVVLAWASFAVRNELQQPKDMISNNFEADTIELLSSSALGLAVAVLVATVLTGIYQWQRSNDGGDSSSARPAGEEQTYMAMGN